MLGFPGRIEERQADAPPGAEELVFCIFNEKRRLVHHFSSCGFNARATDPKLILEEGEVQEAFSSRRPVSLSMAYGDGRNKYLHILPYEYQPDRWRVACFRMISYSGATSAGSNEPACSAENKHFCLLLVNPNHVVESASLHGAEIFGCTAKELRGRRFSELFAGLDPTAPDVGASDTNRVALSCVISITNGTKRDVDVRTYTAADGWVLYTICDTTPPVFMDDPAQVATRERRRIGQDLHDSIGQVMTGISLLSRSLANNLKKSGNAGYIDALQVSALADDASNQIRQISRGLIPTDVVQKGLVESLRDLAKSTAESCGVACDTRLDDTVEFSDGAVETHLFRIAQEAVNNAVRHAEASRIEISLLNHAGRTALRVTDNGTWKGRPRNLNGIGMKTMEYRAMAIGGCLEIGALERGGSYVACTLGMDEFSADGIKS